MGVHLRWPLLMLALLTGAAAAAAGPLATVGKVSISRAQLEEAMLDLGGPQTLLRLVDQELIFQAGRQAGVLVSEAEGAAELSRVAKAFPEPAAFDAALNDAHLDRTALIQRIRADLTLENLALRSFRPTEEELVQHYVTHRGTFGWSAAVRARHMAAATESEAMKLKEQIDGGRDFGTVARAGSLDSATRERGGDMGELALTRPYARGMVSLTGEPVPVNVNGLDTMGPTTDRLLLWQKAQGMGQAGVVSDPFRSAFGYSLVELVERREGKAPPFPEVRDLVRSHLFRTRYPLALDLLRWELRQKAAVAVNHARYQNWSKPAGAMAWKVDPNLVDPMHPSLINLRVYGLQDVLRLYLVADIMQDYDALRLVTKNFAYAARMAEAGGLLVRLDRAIEEVELAADGHDGWSKMFAKARIRYREGKLTWTVTTRLSADVLSGPSGYSWKVVEQSPPIKESQTEGSR